MHVDIYHPGHTFSSIVYSQALRIKCIVPDNKFKQRLSDLERAFNIYGYKKSLVHQIVSQVMGIPLVLEYRC